MICVKRGYARDIDGYKGELVYDTTKPDGAPYKTVDGTLGAKLRENTGVLHEIALFC